MQNIYKVLQDIEVKYQKHDHPAVYTVQEAKNYDRGDAGPSKNLFLRNKKGDKHFLVVLEASKRVNLKELATILAENNLSLASEERLLKYLQLTPGSVSPFGLINDVEKEVNVIVDRGLFKFEKQGFHPNINTSTLIISTADFKKFLDWTQNKITYIEF